jgi:hypothetical protein
VRYTLAHLVGRATRVGSGLTRKRLTILEKFDSNKHCSLLLRLINYGFTDVKSFETLATGH